MSWSYAAFYLATGGIRWLAGAGAFLFTFATVCLIDASLMTLDRWARRYDHRVTSEPRAHWADRTRDVLSIGTRVGLVALSMYITAPFLAQLMFNDDIERALGDERVAMRATARQTLLEPINRRLSRASGATRRAPGRRWTPRSPAPADPGSMGTASRRGKSGRRWLPSKTSGRRSSRSTSVSPASSTA